MVNVQPTENRLEFRVGNGSASVLSLVSNALSSSFVQGWNLVGISINEASGTGGNLYVNGDSANFNPTYASPSATNADAQPNGLFACLNWSLNSPRYGGLIAWNRALSVADLSAMYADFQDRYPLP